MSDESRQGRLETVKALLRLANPAAVPALTEALDDEDVFVQIAARRAIEEMQRRERHKKSEAED